MRELGIALRRIWRRICICLKVVGNVVSTQKDPNLVGCKLLIIKKINENGEFEKYSSQSTAIAVDSVDAGIEQLSSRRAQQPVMYTATSLLRSI